QLCGFELKFRRKMFTHEVTYRVGEVRISPPIRWPVSVCHYTPQQFDIEKLKREMTRNIPEVRNIHHVHLWQVGERPLMTLHVQVIPPRDHDGLLHRIQDYLLEHYHIGHATIQMEYQRCEEDHCVIHQIAVNLHAHHPH
ncbi:MAG: hypothetical protein ACR5LH_00565, partial [Sodalis sp. (in: enterobacteria)]